MKPFYNPLLIFSLVFSPVSFAATSGEGLLNKLLAPGPLIAGHKNLESKDCLLCHSGGEGVPDSKCLDCHKEIQHFIAEKSGFHGLAKESCIKCHADHKGREFDSTLLNPKEFDHNKTGFKLSGKHTEIECSKCHLEKRDKKPVRPGDLRYLGKTSTCVGCHKKDDVHFFKGPWAKKDCNSCHAESSWKKELKFDHNKDTKYPLEEKHALITCKECHAPKGEPTAKYEWKELKQQQCLSCHTDYHKSAMSPQYQGGKCKTCHNQTDWKFNEKHPFNHEQTQYPLRGKHAELECIACHKEMKKPVSNSKSGYWKGLSKACVTCHGDSYHFFGKHSSPRLKNAKNCQDCHYETSWNKTHGFNHDSSTRYTLTGKHLNIGCNECHIAKGWTDKTKLPKNYQAKYLWPDLLTKTCENCHANPHTKTFKKELLAKKCTECHVTDDWNKMRTNKGTFNHDQDTRFQIAGKHKELKCNSCHVVNKKAVYRFSDAENKFCGACHKNIHLNQFSNEFKNRQCIECHTQDNFTKRKPFEHGETRYKLRGKHATVECAKCHTKSSLMLETAPPKYAAKFLFPMLSKNDCADCHKDPHKGNYGNNCSQCHDEKDWKTTANFHKNFTLTGVHYTLQCKECHIGDRILAGMSQNCYLCHQKDDVHQGSLPNCGACHAQHFWENAEYKHSLTRFPLRGAHRTLECNACHSNGIYQGAPNRCIDCHTKDYLSETSPPHIMPAFENCARCHNQFSFH